MSMEDRTPDLEELFRDAGPRAEIDARDLAQIDAAVRAEWRHRTGEDAPSRTSRLPVVALAATVVLALGAALWWIGSLGSMPDAPLGRVTVVLGEGGLVGGQSVGVGDSLRVASLLQAQGPLALELETGHSVRLEAGSELQLRRDGELELRGGAVYVDSGAEDRPPVAVVTAFGRVVDIGTQFEVRLRADAVEVRVREGSVELSRGDVLEIADAGESLVLDDAGDLRRSEIASHGSDWQWALEVAPPLPTSEPTAAQLLEWYAREAGLEVRFASDEARSLGEETFDGLRGAVSIDSALPLLEGVRLQARVDGDQLLVEVIPGA